MIQLTSLAGLVEVKSFVDQLKKEIRAKGLCTPDEKRESGPILH
jgi:hypothetical protein